MDRYKRQIVLPEIGEEGQEKISAASVLVVGAGGLGCPVLQYLAAAGIGRIGIVDFDVVDETNLQRQILFDVNDIGNNKAQCAAKHLSALNPEINIEVFDYELTDKNAEELFLRFDLVIDGTDNFSTKFLINDAALKVGVPFIYGSILGFEGQISVFGVDDGPCYRCLFPSPPKGHIPNCAEAGVIGAVAGMIGTMQAMEAIKLIVGHAELSPLIGKLFIVDVRTMETQLLSLAKDHECQVCSKEKAKIKLSHDQQICGIIPEIMPNEIRGRGDALLIDVREKDEWDLGHIEGAQLVSLSWLLAGNTPDIPKEKNVILYCQKGVRSMQAAQFLKAANFQNISSMFGGYEKWLEEERA